MLSRRRQRNMGSMAAGLACVVVALSAGRAAGHDLRLWAAAEEGATIRGRAYFPGGAPARGMMVHVVNDAGQPLGEVRTDDSGAFAFEARVRCDHRFIAESLEGHGDSVTVEAAALPLELPSVAKAEATAHTAADHGHAEHDDVDLHHAVEESVARHVGALRRQLRAYEDKRRLHEIIGGIGYIVGVTGIAFYCLGRRRRAPTGSDGG